MPDQILTVIEGPAYHPNRFRRVVERRKSDLPGFTVCYDVDEKIEVILLTRYLDRVKAEMAAKTAEETNPNPS